MTENELSILLNNQDRFAEEHRKMSEDVGEIKVLTKESSQNIIFITKNIEAIQLRLEKVEKIQTECPARNRSNSYGTILKDAMFLMSIFAAVAATIAIIK